MNHGISQEIIDGALVAAKEFFSMRMEDKMKLEKKSILLCNWLHCSIYGESITMG